MYIFIFDLFILEFMFLNYIIYVICLPIYELCYFNTKKY